MNAVNLIPVESRRIDAPGLPGAPFLGLLAALVVALAGTVVYVNARNNVSARRSELAQVNAGTAEWSAVAGRYTTAVDAVKHRAEGFEQLGALLGEQADWSLLLSQLAGVMPAHAYVTTMNATTGLSTGAGASGTSTAGPGITMAGCAASQPIVADTMIALRRMTGVAHVSLSSAGLSGGGGSDSAGGGNCPLPTPVYYNILLEFSPSASAIQLLKAVGLGRYLQTSAPAQSTPSTTSTGTAQ